MIRFTLKCKDKHSFESWFQSGAAYDSLRAAGMVSCAICGSTEVEKTLMAPRVTPGRKKAKGEIEATPAPRESPSEKPLSTPTTPQEVAIAALKKVVQEKSDYVGMNFATEARAIHEGTSPERAIYGEAKLEDAKKLIEDGVPVAPLPFTPDRKVN
jgi:hypothetical protein